MKIGRRVRAAGVRAVVMTLVCGMLSGVGRTQVADGTAQMQNNGRTQTGRQPGLGDQGDKPVGFPGVQEKQAKLRNDDRQRRLVSDTEKLLALATLLHADVAKTDKNVLSLDVVRRAEEIEKLARGVKDRMKS